MSDWPWSYVGRHRVSGLPVSVTFSPQCGLKFIAHAGEGTTTAVSGSAIRVYRGDLVLVAAAFAANQPDLLEQVGSARVSGEYPVR